MDEGRRGRRQESERESEDQPGDEKENEATVKEMEDRVPGRRERGGNLKEGEQGK